MTAPNPSRQLESWSNIDKLFADPNSVWVVHYSCESFYDRPQGRSPRITSIAVRNLGNGQTTSFSIHKSAERQGVALAGINGSYDGLEKKMLAEYFAFLKNRQGGQFLHWNMRDANFGFQAIEHRYEVLKGRPYVVPDHSKIDLSRLLVNIYGDDYIGHPRLDAIMSKNGMEVLDFLTGKQEADAFDSKNFAALHQSTLRKSHVIANIARKVHDRQLKTNASWWAMRGGRLRYVAPFVAKHWLVTTAGGVATLIGILYRALG
jgi:hypothetical protein